MNTQPNRHLLRRQELQQMARVAPIIEHEAKQYVLFRNKVAEGHLSFGHLSRRQELQPMTIVASNIEHRAQQEVLLK